MSNQNKTDAYLAALQQVGDPLADEVIGHVYRQGERRAVNELWLRLLHNDQLPTDHACPELVQFLETTGKLPAWMKPEKVRAGEDLFMDHGLFALVSLLCASLPECYVMKHGVQVLWATQRLEAHTFRRLFETAQMVVAVMSAGGLSPQGAGVVMAQKVRLMHAAMRHLILQPRATPAESGAPKDFAGVLASMSWDQAKLGYPINQEDMVYTLLTFSYVIPRAMKRLGADITPDQQEAFLHCWNVVGYVMGVQEELLPANVAEAAALFARIQALEGGESEAGKALTAALVGCVEGILPAGWTRRLPRLVVRQLVGPATAKLLGLPRLTWWDRVLMGLLWLAEHLGEAVWNWMMRRVSRHFGESLVRHITTIPRGWQRQLFDLPDHLATAWRIQKQTIKQ